MNLGFKVNDEGLNKERITFLKQNSGVEDCGSYLVSGQMTKKYQWGL